MKQRTAGHQNALDEVARLIKEAVIAGDPNVLHIIPSTLGTLKAAADWAPKERWHVVGLREYFGPAVTAEYKPLTPGQLLAICRGVVATDGHRLAVIFSDQFVSAEYAPLFVQQGAKETFYPSLEVIAAAQYGFSISYWNGASFSPPITLSSRNHADILRLLKQYYEACEALGESWLMREPQYQRTLTGRIESAKHRLRFYQSIVMLSTTDDAIIQAQIPLLEELSSLHHLLPKNPAP